MQLKLHWTTEAPAELVRSLYSREGRRESLRSSESLPSTIGEFIVGYQDVTQVRPSLVIVREADAPELLGWIATYAPEAFPISQTARLLSLEDYGISDGSIALSRAVDEEFVWSSVILGEMASQGQRPSTVDKIPVSRAFGCLSYAVARTNLLYRGSKKAIEILRQRISEIENDKLFSRKPISIEVLQPIWSLAEGSGEQDFELSNAIHVIMSALDSAGPRGAISDLEQLNVDVRKMSSGPIEQRVIEFERASLKLVQEASISSQLRSRTPMYLAAFAFWVGQGTTHISLLEDFENTFPSVYAWTGLFAGLGGPTCWDSRWMRAYKAVDRLVRVPFALTDPPVADLSWAEYQLIKNQNRPGEWVKELVKLNPRALTVELLAGAACQLRLSDLERERHEETVNHASDVTNALNQRDVDNIALAIEMLLDVVRNNDAGNQEQLFKDLQRPESPPQKKRVAKRVR
ncbi:hypothetical protein [Hylemonella gracilis]|uniref:hypothetical protein n=1 Tax=Hylemonella gracilis TaxID=80880 RepID=UPI00103C3649|nr:hypothetical protein [Hylemonella gracilis]